MPVVDQKITMVWNKNNKPIFTKIGYSFTQYGDTFEIDVKDLNKKSPIEVMFQCDYCHEIKSKKRSNIRDVNVVCCNDACRKMFDRKRTTFHCAVCNVPVERNDTQIAKNKTGIFFCSHECANRISRKDPSKWITIKCEQCDEEYEILKSSYEKFGSRFCSVPCRNKWESENRRGENHHLFKAELIPCTSCGKENFVCQSKIKQQDNHFCNTECRQKWFADVWSQSEEWKLECSERAVKMLSDGIFGKDSSCQDAVNKMLIELEIEYENEYNCRYYSVDNYLKESSLMIEVMGSFWHSDPRFYKTIEYQHQVDRIKNDKAKNSYIKNNYGVNVLYLWEYDIKHFSDACKQLILAYVSKSGVLDNYHSFNYSSVSEDNIEIINNISPYFFFEKKEIRHLIKIKDINGPRSMKQHDKWITFNCDYCGEPKEQLKSHYNNSITHCCSCECAHELRRGKKLNKDLGIYS